MRGLVPYIAPRGAQSIGVCVYVNRQPRSMFYAWQAILVSDGKF
jgi:hypothetical protein